MPTTLSATVTAGIRISHVSTDDVGPTSDPQNVRQESGYTNGKGDDEADIVYRTRVTVTTGSPNQDLDLYGTLEDVFGNTLNFEHVKAFVFRNLSTTEGDDIYVGPLGVSNPLLGPWVDANGKNCVQHGGALLIDAPHNGYNVETTGQFIRIQYQGTSGSINVQVCILGASGDLESSSSSSSSVVFSSSSSSSSSSSVAVSSSSSSSSVVFSSSSSSSSSLSASSESSSSSSVALSSSSSSSSSVAVSSSSSSSSFSRSASSSSSSSVVVSSSSSSQSSSAGISSSSLSSSSQSSSAGISSSSSSSSSSTSSISSQG